MTFGHGCTAANGRCSAVIRIRPLTFDVFPIHRQKFGLLGPKKDTVSHDGRRGLGRGVDVDGANFAAVFQIEHMQKPVTTGDEGPVASQRQRTLDLIGRLVIPNLFA